MNEKKIITLLNKFQKTGKGTASRYQGFQHKDGYITGTNGCLLGRCKSTYPVQFEGQVLGRTGENKGTSYPDVLEILKPAKENVCGTIAIDYERMKQILGFFDLYKKSHGHAYIAIHNGGTELYFNCEYLQAYIRMTKYYGIKKMSFTKVCTLPSLYSKSKDGSEFLLTSNPNYATNIIGSYENGISREVMDEVRDGFAEERDRLQDDMGAGLKDNRDDIARMEKNLKLLEKIRKKTPAPIEIPEDTTAQETETPEAAELPDEENGDFSEENGDMQGKDTRKTVKNEDDGLTEEERLDGTTADRITRRMLARLRENENNKAKGIRPWQIIKRHPMPLDDIAKDDREDYRIYLRPYEGVDFKNITEKDISGAEAVRTYTGLMAHCGENTESTLALQIRHREKGVVSEWFWADERGVARAATDGPADPGLAGLVAFKERSRKKRYHGKIIDVETIAPSLREAIISETGDHAKSLLLHLGIAGITDWQGFGSKEGIYRLRDELRSTCAPSSAKTYMAVIKGFLARHDEERGVCTDYRSILKNKADKPVKTWLTKDDLRKVEECEGLSELEKLVRARFLIGAYSGMRISDAMEVSETNVSRGMLTYVSKKTGTEATVPCPKKVLDLISYVRENDREMSLVTYNNTIRDICRKAGIETKVKTRHGGKMSEGPKWQFVSSHTARISFATNLANAGVPLIQLAGMMGHSSTQMTERYIVSKSVRLSERAMAYFA